jgi:hypothetical protein
MNLKMLPKMIYIIIPAIIMSRYPFIQNLTVTSFNYVNGQLIVNGTMDVYFSDQTWEQFGYKDDNFDYFNQWWEQNEGDLRFGAIKLVDITWTLLEEHETYDKLEFTAVLERK